VAAGYEILSFSEVAGVDTFSLQRRAPFVFYQGHPEYDAGALFREYRRDVGRFLGGTMEHYPEMPAGYFDHEQTHSFNAFRARAQRQRSRDLLEEFPESSPVHLWHDVAIRLYGNWLETTVAARGSKTMLTVSGAAPSRSP
jgi:homoserine O-succinyltransferase